MATSPTERVTRRTPPVPAGGSHQLERVLPSPRTATTANVWHLGWTNLQQLLQIHEAPKQGCSPVPVQGLELKDDMAVVTGPGGTEQGCTLGDIRERLARPPGRGKGP